MREARRERVVGVPTIHEIEQAAKAVLDVEISDLPKVKVAQARLDAAKPRLEAAAKCFRDLEARTRNIEQAVIKAERELSIIESGQTDLATDAILGNADARKKFSDQERQAEELRALLAHCGKAMPRLKVEAKAAGESWRDLGELVTKAQEELACEKARQKGVIAEQRMKPK